MCVSWTPPPPPLGCQQRGYEEDRASMQHTTLRGTPPALQFKKREGGVLSHLGREGGVEEGEEEEEEEERLRRTE